MSSNTPSHETAQTGHDTTPTGTAEGQPRRGFLKRAAALAVGAVVTLFPFAAGLAVFFDPLNKRKSEPGGDQPNQPDGVPAGFIRVASLDAVPDDGTPRFFKVIDDRTDAWTYHPPGPVGSVFLRKQQDGSVVAFNVTCPHLGCAVNFRDSEKSFYCPCHRSRFSLQGERSPSSPSPRDLDGLEVRSRDGQVYVKYRDFRAGLSERVPV